VDVLEIAKTFGTLVASAIIGTASAYIKASNRVENLESWKKEYVEAVKEKFSNLGGAWKLELDTRDQNIKEKINELKTQLKEVADSFERFQRASHHDFASDLEFTRFVEEMNRQWKTVERTLGHIEGWMKAQPKGMPTFPP
jgi:recombinational DNA repair protein RecT